MTQVGRFGGNAFVHCKKKGLCGPSVLPGPDEGGHLSPNREELSPGCVGLLFMKDKEAGPQCSLFGRRRKTAAASPTKPVRTNWVNLLRVVRALVRVFKR